MHTLPENTYRERINFSKIRTTVPIPNLIEIQKKSYERFLQMNRLPEEREDIGLQSVFKSVFPISDFRENSSLEFIEYSIGSWECKCGRLSGLNHLRRPCTGCGAVLEADPVGEHDVNCPSCGRTNRVGGVICDICGDTVDIKLKYDVEECQERGMTYAVPLKVAIRLVVWNKSTETGAKTIRDIKEQEVYFGDIPLMTDNGTFIINGTERVIVSQLHRSPGAFFHSEDKALFVAQIIPYRGSWVEFEYDAKNLLYVRIDRKRKFLASVCEESLDADPSTPRPTGTPLSRYRISGAAPDASRMFEVGQWPTPVLVAAMTAMSRSETWTAWANQTSGPIQSTVSAYCIGRIPNNSWQ